MEFQREFILIADRVQIRYYGIIIVFAMLVAAWVATRLAKRSGLDPDHVWGGLTWGIIPGIIFARLWFILFPPVALTAGCGSTNPAAVCKDTAWFLQNFFNLQEGAIAIWSGGLSIFGALLGGGIGVYIYMRRNKLPMGVWLDIAAVAIPLAQFIGRWANYVNQELYGTVTTLPWGITIESSKRVGIYKSMVDYPVTTLFHPLFLYEGLWSLIAFFVLLNLWQRRKQYRFLPGDLFLIYVAQYAVIRFLLEFLRVEVAYLPGTTINSSQVACIIGFVGALLFYIYRHRPGAVSAGQDASSAEPAPQG